MSSANSKERKRRRLSEVPPISWRRKRREDVAELGWQEVERINIDFGFSSYRAGYPWRAGFGHTKGGDHLSNTPGFGSGDARLAASRESQNGSGNESGGRGVPHVREYKTAAGVIRRSFTPVGNPRAALKLTVGQATRVPKLSRSVLGARG